MTIRAGQRRCFITIEALVQVRDKDNGSVTNEWQQYAQLWASVETLKGSDRIASATAWPSADQKITFRYIAGVLPTMRVVFKDTVYSILNVNNVEERNRELILTTNSGVKNQ